MDIDLEERGKVISSYPNFWSNSGKYLIIWHSFENRDNSKHLSITLLRYTLVPFVDFICYILRHLITDTQPWYGSSSIF